MAVQHVAGRRSEAQKSGLQRGCDEAQIEVWEKMTKEKVANLMALFGGLVLRMSAGSRGEPGSSGSEWVQRRRRAILSSDASCSANRWWWWEEEEGGRGGGEEGQDGKREGWEDSGHVLVCRGVARLEEVCCLSLRVFQMRGSLWRPLSPSSIFFRAARRRNYRTQSCFADARHVWELHSLGLGSFHLFWTVPFTVRGFLDCFMRDLACCPASHLF